MSSTAADNGYVYVLSNEAMPGMVKIGVTAGDDAQTRINRQRLS